MASGDGKLVLYGDKDLASPYVMSVAREIEKRARARQVQAWVRSDLMPIRIERNTRPAVKAFLALERPRGE